VRAARLARILGVPRQRVDQYLGAKAAGPDAERTLLLLAWFKHGGMDAISPESDGGRATPAHQPVCACD
jgi:hypothetical protein